MCLVWACGGRNVRGVGKGSLVFVDGWNVIVVVEFGHFEIDGVYVLLLFYGIVFLKFRVLEIGVGPLFLFFIPLHLSTPFPFASIYFFSSSSISSCLFCQSFLSAFSEFLKEQGEGVVVVAETKIPQKKELARAWLSLRGLKILGLFGLLRAMGKSERRGLLCYKTLRG